MLQNTASASAFSLSRYTRLVYKNFDAVYVRLERGVKPEHEHASLQISVALSRQPLIALERKSFGVISKQPLMLGESCIIPSWQRHAINWDWDSEWISFHLDPRFVERAKSDLGVKSSIEIISSFGVNDRLIFCLGHALGNLLRCDEEPSQLSVELLTGTLIERLLSDYATNKTNLRFSNGGLAPQKLRRVIEFIDAHLALNLTMEELAESVELSQFHFARAFKQSTGVAPHQFIVRRRMEKAQLMLIDKKVSIGEVAHRVGYQSHSRFSRLFQKHTALTPRQFRELL